MEILNKHYEKIILAICLLLMIFGLLSVTGRIGEAKQDREGDKRQRAGELDLSSGEMVGDFDGKIFQSKEGWIQRIKTGKEGQVLAIADTVAGKTKNDNNDDVTGLWDRRYFSILTRHSKKPIEETEAKYRLEKNGKELVELQDAIRRIQEKIDKRIAESGDDEDDARLIELRMQLEGYQALLANTEMDIVDLKKRVRYISMYCTKQGSLVDPQEVVCCPNKNCGSLMLSTEEKCPFCGTDMPVINPAEEDEGKDTDGDGLPDTFELAHMQKRGFLKPVNKPQQQGMGGDAGMGMGMGEGMNAPTAPNTLSPYNPNDANEDYDGDSFTNLEEYRFGTDIDDERSYPDPANFARVDKFEQEKMPFKFMGINTSKVGKEQKAMKWRAKFSFMRKVRGREIWEKNEDNWEQVRIGKILEAPDGKRYVINDIDEEEVNGEKKSFVKITEYVPPVKAKKVSHIRKKNEEPEPEPEPVAPAEPKTYTMYEDQELYYDTWYAQLIYCVTRNANMLQNVYYNNYFVMKGGRNVRVQTRFKVEEGQKVTFTIPFEKKSKENKDAEQKPQQRFSRLNRNNGMQGDMGGGMMGNGGMMDPGMDGGMGMGMTSREYEMKEFSYKITKFDREGRKLTMVKLDEDGKEGQSFDVGMFKEDEKYQIGERKFLFFYEGAGGGMGGDMMDGGMGNPGMMMGPGR